MHTNALSSWMWTWMCASGFSDGASYALSLGAANGDLFTHIAAFSPGFMRPPVSVGGCALAWHGWP